MSRRCALAHHDAARAIVHDGRLHGLSAHAIARSVDQHRISRSAVRRYIRRYDHELNRLELIRPDGAMGSAHPGSANPDHGSDCGTLVSSLELNAMIDLMIEGLGVVAKRDVTAKEARIRADPNAHIPRQGSRGLSKETVMAIRHQVLGSLD